MGLTVSKHQLILTIKLHYVDALKIRLRKKKRKNLLSTICAVRIACHLLLDPFVINTDQQRDIHLYIGFNGTLCILLHWIHRSK